MTTKDIILELAYCINLNRKPEKELLENTIGLIKHQKAELDKYEQIKTTINRFWDMLLKLTIAKRKEPPTLEEFAEAIQEIEAEAYKECIEKLKEKYGYYDWESKEIVYPEDDLDNFLKEMVGKQRKEDEGK